jgi:hypothetical protein
MSPRETRSESSWLRIFDALGQSVLGHLLIGQRDAVHGAPAIRSGFQVAQNVLTGGVEVTR